MGRDANVAAERRAVAGVVAGVLMAAAGAVLSVADGVAGTRVLAMGPTVALGMIVLGHWFITGGAFSRHVLVVGVVSLLLGVAIAALPRGGGCLLTLSAN